MTPTIQRSRAAASHPFPGQGPGPIAYRVVRDDGVVVATASAALSAGVFTALLPQDELGEYTLETQPLVGQGDPYAYSYEVVSPPYLTVDQVRDFDADLEDPIRYTDAKIQQQVAWAEAQWERFTSVSFVPRVRSETVRYTPGGGAILRGFPILRLVDGHYQDGTVLTPIAGTLQLRAGLLVWPLTAPTYPGHLQVRYETGVADNLGRCRPPEDIQLALLVAVKARLLAGNSALAGNEDSFSAEAGRITMPLVTVNRPFGVPFTDSAALDCQQRYRVPVIAS